MGLKASVYTVYVRVGGSGRSDGGVCACLCVCVRCFLSAHMIKHTGPDRVTPSLDGAFPAPCGSGSGPVHLTARCFYDSKGRLVWFRRKTNVAWVCYFRHRFLFSSVWTAFIGINGVQCCHLTHFSLLHFTKRLFFKFELELFRSWDSPKRIILLCCSFVMFCLQLVLDCSVVYELTMS